MILEAFALVGSGAVLGLGCGYLCFTGLEGVSVSRAEDSRAYEQLVQEATELAAEYNLRLTFLDPEDRKFRLELVEGLSLTSGSGAGAGRTVWSVLLWPSLHECDQVRWETEMRVPLALPRIWTIMDAVEAAIRKLTNVPDPEGCRAPGRKRPVSTRRRKKFFS